MLDSVFSENVIVSCDGSGIENYAWLYRKLGKD